MITSILDWLDHRVGIRKLVAATLLEGVPGGAKWRYVWGSCLAFVFSIQLITGLLLMTAYSPSSTDAWSSVHFIQYKMDFGWLIRGLHHFGSQTMVVLIVLHMLQVVIAGAQLPPREVNWWTGIGLLGVVFGLSLTGYLLPWDQKGFWATQVATNIPNSLPVMGPVISQLLVGGEDYGNHTLTRFYGLHVALLPGTLIVLMTMHIAIFRRHGVTSKQNIEGLVSKPENEHSPGSEPFWPRQAFYDMLACMTVFGIMVALLFLPHKHGDEWVLGHGHAVTVPTANQGEEPGQYEYWARAGQRGLGANLDAPADRETENYPARPEWYFLFLFQLLKYFDGPQILIGTFYIPNGVLLLLILLPLFGYGPLRWFGHLFGVLVMVTLIILGGLLTLKALDNDDPKGIFSFLLDDEQKGTFVDVLKFTDFYKDKNNPETLKAIHKAEKFQHETENAEYLAQRACQLDMNGTPVEGGHFLLRNDPWTAGREKFKANCGSCHNFSRIESDPPDFKELKIGHAASDLGNFGSKEWVLGLLHNSLDAKYFGNVNKTLKDDKGKFILDEKGKVKFEYLLTGMDGWRKRNEKMRTKEKWDPQKIAEQEAEFDLIARWLADLAKPNDKRDAALAFKAQDAFFNEDKNKCSTCHSIEKLVKAKDGKETWVKEIIDYQAPHLADYGSADWIRAMIMRPGHKSRYGENNQMPAFRDLDSGPGAELALQEFRETNPKTPDNYILNLSALDRELIIRWMLRDYRPIFGGTPIK